ncbi:MAG: hypothetical protein V3T02_12560 [Alphaproteobacteria bacterium]
MAYATSEGNSQFHNSGLCSKRVVVLAAHYLNIWAPNGAIQFLAALGIGRIMIKTPGLSGHYDTRGFDRISPER